MGNFCSRMEDQLYKEEDSVNFAPIRQKPDQEMSKVKARAATSFQDPSEPSTLKLNRKSMYTHYNDNKVTKEASKSIA